MRSQVSFVVCFLSFTLFVSVIGYCPDVTPSTGEMSVNVQVSYGKATVLNSSKEPKNEQPKTGGVVYTRWGKKACPDNTGAELLYEGITGGSSFDHPGGGANYVCLPKTPQYLSSHVPPYYSLMHGTEYHDHGGIFSGTHNHNPPCAVCYTAKEVKLMIPAITSCPSDWTLEYKGYLMAERDVHKRNAVFECVDENPESIDGSGVDTNGAMFFFTLTTCNGLPCPPYVNKRPITCVVCTK